MNTHSEQDPTTNESVFPSPRDRARALGLDAIGGGDSTGFSAFLEPSAALQQGASQATFVEAKLSPVTTVIARRMDYLNTLTALPKRWISGVSESPSPKAIMESRSLLRQFARYVVTGGSVKVSKVLMGPLPTGGVSIELHVNESNALYVSLHNQRPPEIEVKYADFFFTYTTERKKLPARVMDYYEALIEK